MNAIDEFDEGNLIKIKQKISNFKGDPAQKSPKPEPKYTLTKTGSTASLSPEAIERNLLEELYPDRLFLKECMNDPILMDNDDVAELIRQGNTFLDQRLEYYKARNPFALKLNNI